MTILNDRERINLYKIIVMSIVSTIIEMGSVLMTVQILGQIMGMQFDIKSLLFTRKLIDQVDSIAFLISPLVIGNVLLSKILILLLVVVFKNFFVGWISYLQCGFGHQTQARISSSLFERYLSLPLLYHINKNSSILIRNCAQDTNLINQNIINPLFTIISEVFLIIGIAGLLLAMDPALAIITLIFLGSISWLFSSTTSRKISAWGSTKLASEAKRIQIIQQGIGAIKEVKMAHAEKYFQHLYDDYNSRSAKSTNAYTSLQQIPRLFWEVMMYVGIFFLVTVSILLKHDDSTTITMLGLYAASVLKLLPSANKVSISYQSLKMNAPSLDNIVYEFKNTDFQASDIRYERKINDLDKKIELSEISFAYDTKNILTGINLIINKGECIGIVGESGSGKSTLLNIILGLIPPLHGSITIDDIHIKDDLYGWQKNIGYVPQNIFMIDDSLRRNIAFGIPDNLINDNSINRALGLSKMLDFVASLPDGLDTYVGERGVRLSGGQLQRIGIARALYHNPNILILDEATSSLDQFSEAEFMKSIEGLYGLKTIVIVSHRLSTLERCDIIYKIANSKLIKV